MTKLQTLHSFFSSFGLPAYEENSIFAPDVVPTMPYITYGITLSSFDNGDVTLPCSVWYRDYDWKKPEEKANEISKAIGYGGKLIKVDEGYVWFKQPVTVQPMGDPSDDLVKRMYINITAEYLTAD